MPINHRTMDRASRNCAGPQHIPTKVKRQRDDILKASDGSEIKGAISGHHMGICVRTVVQDMSNASSRAADFGRVEGSVASTALDVGLGIEVLQ